MDPQLWRHLSALVRTESQKTKIRHALQNDLPLDPRHAGFHLQGDKVMCTLPSGEEVELLMTDGDVAKMLRRVYNSHGVGKGQTTFYKFVQARYLGVTRVAITAFLKAQAGYALSRKAPHRTNKPIVASEKNELWAIDLIDMWHSEDNQVVEQRGQVQMRTQHRYIMTVVDVFSRKVWLEPLSSKETVAHTTPAFERILARAGVTPRSLMMDRGTEFRGMFARMLRAQKIKARRIRSHTPQANGIVEAENQQVRRLLSEMWLKNRNRTWWSLLPKVEELRNEFHRVLLKSTANKVYNADENNEQLRADVAANAKARMDAFDETVFHEGDKVFVTMATVYSHIRALAKQGDSKKIAIVFVPRVCEVVSVIGTKNERRRYTLREASAPYRMLTNQKRQRGQPICFSISRVYASQLAKCTIKQSQIKISVAEALRINQSRDEDRFGVARF
jgi:transposase InsO family protein